MSEPALWAALREGLEPLGSVRIRRMFGGAGVSVDGLSVGLIADDLLYLKADAASAARFEAEQLEPFMYDKGGRMVAMSYRRAPDAIWDEPETMIEWGALALDAARRSARPKRRA